MKGSLQHVQVSIAEDLQRVKERERERIKSIHMHLIRLTRTFAVREESRPFPILHTFCHIIVLMSLQRI